LFADAVDGWWVVWLLVSRQILPCCVEAAGAHGDTQVRGWIGALLMAVDTSILEISPWLYESLRLWFEGWSPVWFKRRIRGEVVRLLYVVFSIIAKLRIRLSNMLIIDHMSLAAEAYIQRLHLPVKPYRMICAADFAINLFTPRPISTSNTATTHVSHLFNHMVAP
jgi:hypothetical protein